MAELALEGVSKTYLGPRAAVQDLHLMVRDHELVVLVGPSGCGKTTTLRLIAGLEDPSEGLIRIGGRTVNRVPPWERDVAMVFQHGALYPHLSVYENMAFGLRLRLGKAGLRRWTCRWWRAEHPRPSPREVVERAVQEASRTLRIAHLLGRKPRELSGGERQRVALGRALVRRPAVFLLDEPLSHLDPQSRLRLRQELKRLQQRHGATMVYVTHDQAEALALGDRMVVMQQGRIQQVGTPREVYHRPANLFVARFVGEPPMNTLLGRLHGPGSGDTCEFRFVGDGLRVRFPEPPTMAAQYARGQGLAMGVRPEHVLLVPEDESGPGDPRELAARVATSPAPQSGQGTRRQRGRDWICGTGRVTGVEMLGASAVTRVILTDNPTRSNEAARSRPPWAVVGSAARTLRVGTRVAVQIDRARVHWFDAQTGENLMRVAT